MKLRLIHLLAATALLGAATAQLTPGTVTSATATTTGTNIDTNAERESFRDALQVHGAIQTAVSPGLRNLKVAAATGTVSAVMIGDSFNIGFYGGLERVAHIRGAYRCAQVSGGGDSGVTIHDGDDDPGHGPLDYTLSPDGFYYEIASGGNLTCGHLQFATGGPADQVHYTLFPGTGTAQLQYSYSGGAWTNIGSAIDTSAITTVQCGTVALTGSYTNSVRCRVTATGGTVNGWIGQGMEGPGVMIASFTTSGQSMAQTIGLGETRWKAMLTAWGTDLVISSWADGRFVDAAGEDDAVGDDNYADDGPFDRAYDWSKEVSASIDWIFVSPHQVDPTHPMATIAALDAAYTAVGVGNLWDARTAYSLPFLRSFALDRGEAFVDCYHLFPSWEEADAQGMFATSDPVHLSDKGKAYKAALVYSRSGLETVFGTAFHAGGVKVGDAGFINMTQNFGQGAGMGLYTWNGNTANLFAGSVFVMDSVSPDRAGGYNTYNNSRGSLRFGTFNAGSAFDQVEVMQNGIHPVTTLTGSCGRESFRWAGVYAGGMTLATTTKTTTYAPTATDYTLLCDATSGAFDIDLPAAAGLTGRIYIIKKVDASGNAVSIDPNGTELLDGSSTSLAISTQWATRAIQSNGTSWFVIGN